MYANLKKTGKTMKELLCPAGNFEKMKAAILYGADAVYLASDMFGMRAAADNFTLEELEEATKYAHERGVKLYVTVNTMPHTNEYNRLKKYLLEYQRIGVDALIISDLGVFMLAKETIQALPQLDLVVSNPPYISKEEMDELDLSLSYEPKEALFGGDDGLYFYREITRLYYPKIKKGGAIAFEVGFRQADAVSDILKKAGFHSLKEKKDINGVRRAVCAFK